MPAGFELVVDLGHGDDVAVAGEHGGGAADGRGDLEDLGVEDDAGIAAGRGGADDVGAHGAVGGVEGDVLVVDDDHVFFLMDFVIRTRVYLLRRKSVVAVL